MYKVIPKPRRLTFLTVNFLGGSFVEKEIMKSVVKFTFYGHKVFH